MKIVQAFAKRVGTSLLQYSDRKERAAVLAKFDAAQRGGQLAEHWKQADFLEPNAEASPETLRIIRARVRHEYNNNSYCKGIVRTVANYVVGAGPQLRLLPRGEADRTTRRKLYDYANLFNDWFWDVDGARKVRLACESKIKDGEGWLMLGNRGKGDIRLTLRPFECDLVTHNDSSRDPSNPDGVILDEHGDPVAYMILRNHPGGGWMATFSETPRRIDAKWVCHWYDETRPGLARGVPEIAAGLHMFAQLGRYSRAVVTNAEHMAEISGVIHTTTPPMGRQNTISPNTVFELEHNAVLALPEGWEFDQVQPTQTNADHERFMRTMIREMARGPGVPYAVAAADASGHNYSSMRGDWQGFFEEIKVRREDAEHQVLEKILDAFTEEARRVYPEYRNLQNYDYYWDWPGYEHVDPFKVANAQEKKLNNHTTTLAREFAKEGLFYEDEIQQIIYERQLTEALREGRANED